MNVAVVLSGGTGTRVGTDIPKQYIEVNGEMVIARCLRQLISCQSVDAIEVVAAVEWQDAIRNAWKKMAPRVPSPDTEVLMDAIPLSFAAPGETRQDSIRNAMEDLAKKLTTYDLLVENEEGRAPEQHTVLIHDAARPCVSTDLLTRCYEALQGHEGVLPVLPMKDTVYQSVDGQTITGLLERTAIYAGQAPELFLFAPYLNACRKVTNPVNGSTEPAIMAGMDVVMIPGDEANYKITTKLDLERYISDLQK